MGIFVELGSTSLMNFKLDITTRSMSKSVEAAAAYGPQSGNSQSWAAKGFFMYMFLSLSYALMAGLLCWYEPAAIGSGIPEVKAYLNGVNLERAVRKRVLFAKVVGMIFSVASGLPLGKEGPMIHAGSIIGVEVAEGDFILARKIRSLFTGVREVDMRRMNWSRFQKFRNDASKRDFVTIGAAAGVAAAFQAPIGGILFTLEEGASFWSVLLTFRAFLCAMVVVLTLLLLNEGVLLTVDATRATADVTKLISSGIELTQTDGVTFSGYSLVHFAVMGAGGGMMGAFFNLINKRVTQLRMQHYDRMWKRLAELLALTVAFSFTAFVLSYLWGVNSSLCKPMPNVRDDLSLGLISFNCDATQYNEVASLFMVPPVTALQSLFNGVAGQDETALFTTSALLLFGIPYFFFAAFTSGTSIPFYHPSPTPITVPFPLYHSLPPPPFPYTTHFPLPFPCTTHCRHSLLRLHQALWPPPVCLSPPWWRAEPTAALWVTSSLR